MPGKHSKMTDKKVKKDMPLTIMVAVGKSKSLPMRGARTAKNMASNYKKK